MDVLQPNVKFIRSKSHAKFGTVVSTIRGTSQGCYDCGRQFRVTGFYRVCLITFNILWYDFFVLFLFLSWRVCRKFLLFFFSTQFSHWNWLNECHFDRNRSNNAFETDSYHCPSLLLHSNNQTATLLHSTRIQLENNKKIHHVMMSYAQNIIIRSRHSFRFSFVWCLCLCLKCP